VVDVSGDAGPTVPFDAHPDPVCRYTIRDGTAVLGATNGAFTARFEATAPGTPFCEWWDADGLAADDLTGDGVQSRLVAGEDVDTTVVHGAATADARERTYRFRAVPDSDPESRPEGTCPNGYLFFTAVPGDVDGPVGADWIASVVSHDLRNPLDVAEARLRAARETGDEEHFDHLERAHDRMERIVRDVLTLARGQTAVDPVTEVAVEAVAADAWETVDTGDASLSVAEDLPTVEADPDRFRRLFENLFRNSIEHGTGAANSAGDRSSETDEGPVRVRLGATAGGFFVADDGSGIPPADRERVFAPGYTTDRTGAGLGLTIVERIATAHGWTVTATDAATGGARFDFRGIDTGDTANTAETGDTANTGDTHDG
jgi:hypothetical protein